MNPDEYLEGGSRRRKLPNRRECLTVDRSYEGQNYSVTVGYYPELVRMTDDAGNYCDFLHHLNEIGEVFVNGPRIGSDRQVDLYSVGVTASFALQHGAKPGRMARSHPKDEDGSPASLQAAIWGWVAAEDKRE